MAELLDPSHERYRERYPLLEELVSGQSSPQTVAERLAEISFDRSPGEGIALTWEAIMIAAKRMPEHQDELVRLLVSMSDLAPVQDGDGILEIDGMKVWSDLPRFGWGINHEWNGLTVPAEAGPRREQIKRDFVNVNTFVARLFKTGKNVFNFYWYGLVTMREALEHPNSSINLQSEQDVFIAAAAALIITAGSELYHCTEEYEQGPLIGQRGKGGPLWNGKHGFCKERWALWRKRFGEVATLSDLPEDLRAAAERAEARMSEVETSD